MTHLKPNRRWLALNLLLSTGLLFAATSATAQDATQERQTLEAGVQARFTQTAQAQTLTPDPASATLDALFAEAQTATAEGAGGALEVLPTVEAPAQNFDAAGLRAVFEPAVEADEELLRQTSRLMRQRLEALGVSNARVRVDAGNIVLELGSGEDLNALVETLTGPGVLEFVDMSGLNNEIGTLTGQQILTTGEIDRRADSGIEAEPDGMENPLTNEAFETVAGGEDIRSAEARESAQIPNTWEVLFAFTNPAGRRLGNFTAEHVGEPLAIVIDGNVFSIPVIQGEFGRDGGVLSGNFTETEARGLAAQFSTGPLPIPLTLVSIEELGETLPAETQVAVVAQVTPQTTEVATADPSATEVPELFPTPTIGDIQVAEQVFEHGRMFYVQPTDQIWVMVIEGEGEGTWRVYPDNFEEGDTEFDPEIIAPEGLLQPERGFGKLWRENEEVRDMLGWALTPEFGYVTEYRYHPGGTVENDTYLAGPGTHVLFSLYSEEFRFSEVDQTWVLGSGE